MACEDSTQNPCPSQNLFVCSDHFSAGSFAEDLAEEFCGYGKCKKTDSMQKLCLPCFLRHHFTECLGNLALQAKDEFRKRAKQEVLQEIISTEPGPSTNIGTEPDVDIPADMECTDQEHRVFISATHGCWGIGACTSQNY